MHAGGDQAVAAATGFLLILVHVCGHQAPGGVLELPMGGLGGGRQEKASIEELVYLTLRRHLPGRFGRFRYCPHHVVNGFAVAQLGGQPRLEADQVPQAERQPALDEGG